MRVRMRIGELRIGRTGEEKLKTVRLGRMNEGDQDED